jgi:enoyl-CoA hydratase
VTIRTEVADGVATLTLDDPDRRNALTLDMVDRIVAAFEQFEAEDSGVGAVVVTGAPPAFCAGADLSNLQASGEQARGAAADPATSREGGMRSIYEGFLRVGRSPLPTIAAVNGAAVGAGMNLALACDVRVAARRAKFDTRFLQIGLHPGGGHTWMLDRIAGPQTAAAMVLFGEVLDGERAAACGLAWRVVDDDALLDTAREMAGRAAQAPTKLACRVKETLKAVPDLDVHQDAVDLELTAQMWSLAQPEFAERIAALQQRISKR